MNEHYETEKILGKKEYERLYQERRSQGYTESQTRTYLELTAQKKLQEQERNPPKRNLATKIEHKTTRTNRKP